MFSNQEILEQINNWRSLTGLDISSILNQQLERDEDLTDHTNYNGHMTGSGLVIYKDKILLIFHNQLKMWLQPGGHLEYSDKNLVAAAEREVEEETGLKVKLADWHIKNNSPIIIDTHPIPAHKNRPAHFHHDFRYIFVPETDEISLQLSEVEDYAWVDVNDPRLTREKSNFLAYKLAKQFGII